jgi:hypothetical protein
MSGGFWGWFVSNSGTGERAVGVRNESGTVPGGFWGWFVSNSGTGERVVVACNESGTSCSAGPVSGVRWAR